MIKILLTITILALSGCSVFYPPTNKSYSSLGSDFATSTLTLNQEGKFKINCHYFESEDGQPSTDFIFSGDYTQWPSSMRFYFDSSFIENKQQKSLSPEIAVGVFYYTKPTEPDLIADITSPVIIDKETLEPDSNGAIGLFICNVRVGENNSSVERTN